MAKPVLSKEELRAQLEAALANYHGPVRHCPPANRPRLRPDARIVDEDVDATERIQGLFAQTLRRLAIANVMFDGDRTTSQSLCAFFKAITTPRSTIISR
jgi:hypothetical protein